MTGLSPRPLTLISLYPRVVKAVWVSLSAGAVDNAN